MLLHCCTIWVGLQAPANKLSEIYNGKPEASIFTLDYFIGIEIGNIIHSNFYKTLTFLIEDSVNDTVIETVVLKKKEAGIMPGKRILVQKIGICLIV